MELHVPKIKPIDRPAEQRHIPSVNMHVVLVGFLQN
jgi:hypothetical protein